MEGNLVLVEAGLARKHDGLGWADGERGRNILREILFLLRLALPESMTGWAGPMEREAETFLPLGLRAMT